MINKTRFVPGVATVTACIALFFIISPPIASSQSVIQADSRTYIVTPSQLYHGTWDIEQGNDSRFLPFDNHANNEGEGMRFQQVFMASEFGGNAGYIRALYFRADAAALTQAARVDSLQINLSTTLATVTSLSPVFANNIGADEQVFWGATGTNLITSFGGWDISFFTEEPFYYDPSRGNLLMEIKNFSGSRPGDSLVLDAHRSGEDGVASIATYGVDRASGGYDSAGYVMLIEMVQVPEAAAWKLAMLGAVILVVMGRRRFI